MFKYEFFSTAQGIKKYNTRDKRNKSLHYLLRRNIHRLEKGIIMTEPGSIFALDYISETIDVYTTLLSDGSVDDLTEAEWATDVIRKYFTHTKLAEFTQKEQTRFALISSKFTSHGAKVPYKRNLQSIPPVHYNSLLALAKQRRSVRHFVRKEVTNEVLDKALEVATLSPTACNRQPFEFKIINDQHLIKQISSIPSGSKAFQYIPTLVVACGKLDAFQHEYDRHLIYIDTSLSTMSLLFSLETLGLSSCIINWPSIPIQDKQIRKIIKIKPEEQVVFLIAVGYPDTTKEVAFSQKKSLPSIKKHVT